MMMISIVYIIMLMTILFYALSFNIVECLLSTINKDPIIAISMTTIPPRYNYLTECLLSWLNQDLKPNYIFIFIPKQYKRFKRKKDYNNNNNNNNNEQISFKKSLMNILNNTLILKEYIRKNIINVIEIEKDWGPISKVMGMLYYNDNWYNYNIKNNRPDYWIIGDDDVKYLKNTISDYIIAINTLPIGNNNNIKNNILTHFPEDNRIKVNINNENITINHVQGVDTILFPTILLLNQCLYGYSFCYNNLIILLKYFHKKCSDSFYQDDYIISYSLALGSIKVNSIWNNDNVAKNIDGISKSNMQMHLNSKVFKRESNTKECIILFSNEIQNILNNNNNNNNNKYDL